MSKELILIVDDEPHVQAEMAATLARDNYRTVLAPQQCAEAIARPAKERSTLRFDPLRPHAERPRRYGHDREGSGPLHPDTPVGGGDGAP